MSEKTILLKVLEFSPVELECLLKTAVQLLYIDGIADINEWNIISLVPALLEIEQENASPDLKAQWKEKLEAASQVIREQASSQSISDLNVREVIPEGDKRETFLIILFMVAFADNKLNKIELNFIMNNIARPWNLAPEEIVAIITRYKNSISGADEIVQLLKSSIIF